MKRFFALSAAYLAAVWVLLPLSTAEASPPGHWNNPALTLDIADLSTDTDPFTRVAGPSGPTTFGFVGTPVAAGFDMDGDGHQDFAVGHMTTTNGPDRVFAGEVQLVFGNGSIGETVDLDSPGSRVLRILGDGFFEATGSEIWMGDVTGDGLGDLLVHRQNFNPGDRLGAGALSLVVGSSSLSTLAAAGQVLDLRNPDPSVTVFTLVGAAENDRLGMWARVGDIDGDHIDDFIVAADQESNETETFHGAVYVVRGGAHLAQNATVDLADFGSTILAGDLAKIVPPTGADDWHFGATNQVADLDRNGRGEVLIAAALNRAGGALAPDGTFSGDGAGGPPGGRLFILWDNTFRGYWPPGFLIDLDSPPRHMTTISGGVQNVSFGEEIIGGLDYDGDRRPDLFVGDLAGDGTDDQSRPAAGVGYIFFKARRLKGKTFNIDDPPRHLRITKIAGPVAGAIGSDTVTHGDFNGDGIDDLVIGNPHDNPQGRFHAGTMHVLFGRHGRWPRFIDTAVGELPRRQHLRITLIEGALGEIPNPNGGFPAANGGDTLCYSAAAGDIDGDGKTDIVTNEMVGDGVNQIDVGNLVIFSGDFVSPRRHGHGHGHGDDD